MKKRFMAHVVIVVFFTSAIIVFSGMAELIQAQCPNTIKHKSLCPSPESTAACANKGAFSCFGTKGQKKYSDYWTCKFANASNLQCLDSNIDGFCWDEWDCEWSILGGCSNVGTTIVRHKQTLKVSLGCGGG